MAIKRIHAIVKGKVQGVFYREFTRREADLSGVSGYVRNMKDGNVEIVAEGEEKKLKEFEKKFRKGPLMAFVTGVELKEEQATGEFEGFDLRF
ncbi:MAG TPA: acylphosphatase [Candidatus Nanoarchaeia archaeon]|nr:acylphosphatase [Candidatus Nanoarchaeia archaeon]